MANLTTEIKDLLAAFSPFIGYMPPNPNNAICIFHTGGFDRDLSGTYLEEPTFQVKVRNENYSDGETLCNAIKDALHGVQTATILMIEQMGDIHDLGRDANQRPEFTLNFRCYHRR